MHHIPRSKHGLASNKMALITPGLGFNQVGAAVRVSVARSVCGRLAACPLQQPLAEVAIPAGRRRSATGGRGGAELADGTRVVVARLPGPEFLAPGDAVVLLQEWLPGSSSLGPPNEFVVKLADDIEAVVAAAGAAVFGPAPPAARSNLTAGAGVEPTAEYEPAAPPPLFQLIRPWDYQLKDPASLHVRA